MSALTLVIFSCTSVLNTPVSVLIDRLFLISWYRRPLSLHLPLSLSVAQGDRHSTGGQLLRLNHGDILIFDAGREEHSGAGLVHGVDKIKGTMQYPRQRVSVQVRGGLNGLKQIIHIQIQLEV